MSEEEKELQKLTANWLNTMAAGSVTAGVITPIVGYQFGLLKMPFDSHFVGGSLLWFIIGLVIHIVAHLSLLGYGKP